MKPDGRGAAIGLKKGDVILEIDGKVVSDVSAFSKSVAEAKKRGVVRLLAQRGSSTIYLAESL